MDYGFAPGRRGGRDRQDDRLRMMFQRRANTTLIFRRRITTVRGFITHLDTAGGIVRPVGDLLIGGHANSEGQIFIPMYPRQRGPTEFETLEQTLANPARSIKIPDALIGYTAGDPITHSVHFKGCNIGKTPPFLVKFREALGEHVNVTAPKHFHGLTPARNQGIFEYMAYEFIIRRRNAFANRNAAIAGFQAVGFTLIDGSAVPNNAWANRMANWQERWIPRRINRTREDQVPAPLGVNIGRRNTINTPQQFRVDRLPFTWTITYPNVGSVPAGDAARLQALENSLQADPRFDAAHDFPKYERLGYPTFADFFAGYNWRCRRHGRRLVCTGRRVEYTVVVPIADPTTGNLIFNFYPNAGSPHAAITTGLQESDTDYFETV